MGMETTAVQNLKRSYKARFRLDSDGKTFIFSSDDYGHGVFCSTEKYQYYVAEFEQFLDKKVRFMRIWLVVVIIMSLNITILSIPFEDGEFYKYWKDSFKIMVWAFMGMPLLFIFKQGWTLYNKPIYELGENALPVKRRKNSSVIREKRLKGMPSIILVLGIITSLLGLYFSLTGSGYDSPYMTYYFGIIFIGSIVISILKYKAHNKARKKESIDTIKYKGR